MKKLKIIKHYEGFVCLQIYEDFHHRRILEFGAFGQSKTIKYLCVGPGTFLFGW